jgi:hypothetical protein
VVNVVLGRFMVSGAMVVVAMVLRRESGSCGKHHQKQGKGKKLFHGLNVARSQRKR